MAFDINKYEDEIFHEVEEINNRIKVLLLWSEYQVESHTLNTKAQINLMDNILGICIKKEWYEIATFFKKRKDKLVNNG